VRVVETADARGEMCGRVLADLGAQVIKVEPPGGAASRGDAPVVDGVSLPFAVRNAGKRSVVADLTTTAGRDRLLGLLGEADVWIEASRLSQPWVERARERNPALVVLSITDFGNTGPYRDWVATDSVLLAMGGVLSRSGLPGREPLMPPGDMALQLTTMQAAWAALVAYWNRLDCGVGDHIDFSLYEATVQAIEPALGTVGTAQAAGYAPTRGRPAPGPYPIFSCRDGHVRVVLLAPRQWHAMRAWLGDPPELRDAALETIRGRALASERLHAIFERHFAERGKHELAREGQARGVPVAPVLTLADVLSADHFRVRGAIARRELAPELFADVPTGFAEIDGRRVRPAGRARQVGEHDDGLWPALPPPPAARPAARGSGRRPLKGLRILDFGVIVLGAEVARLFCELGAEVIKVESGAFPDGARVSPIHFAIGHRGSQSFGVNLRSAEGVEVVKRLVGHCDVVLSNFKPGTLEKLGLGPRTLREVNPGIVVLCSSALGVSGPWRGWLGYGPLVRCISGLTSLWRYPDDEASFSDATTIHPDHYAARLCAITALAALIARRRTGVGGEITTSQAEAILMQIAPLIAHESFQPGSTSVSTLGSTPGSTPGATPGSTLASAVPWGIYPCAGDDEWCVVTVRDDADWRALRVALGEPEWAAGDELLTAAGRATQQAAIDRHLSEWTRANSPRAVAAILQRHGVPAGFMQRPDEYEQDPQLRARDFLRTFEQPGLAPMRIENAPFRAELIAAPPDVPAPKPGEHTRQICRELLAIDDYEIDRLLTAGALEAPAEVGAVSAA
jgi:crotonobetainyl-CoA:carnitine CoA-transferase CaiB-like acyl-CoA transferase